MVVLIHKIILLLSMQTFLGVMRFFSPLLASSSTTATGLTITAIAIAAVLLASTIPTIYAQLMNQPLGIENGIAATTTVQSKNDSFRVQVPEGWVIQDVNNSGPALGAEVLQGYGILAQLCPEEEQRPRVALTNASGNTSSDSNSNDNCQGAQDEVIYIVRYPNLGARLGLDSDDIISNESIHGRRNFRISDAKASGSWLS